ncbi:MAG: hypothetical protein PHE89_06775 [Alphaproteobacteria bacterium]|nr:hypothetical protein [Alphaproteobacteria bacterium]
MKIIEKFIQGKNPNQDLCEDGLFCSDDFVVVIDGATAKSNRLFEGKTSGRIAMEVISMAVSSLHKEATAPQAFELMTQALIKFYQHQGILSEMLENPHQRPTASVVVYSRFHQEIWSVGDCQALVDGKAFQPQKFIDFIMSEMRAYFLAAEIKSGKTEQELMARDTGREFISPMLQKQCLFQNNAVKSPYSFAVVDGTKIPEEEIVVYDVKQAKEIILASDGYSILFPTLEETEKELQRIVNADPLCYKENKGTKGILEGNVSFDDRSYIRFIL